MREVVVKRTHLDLFDEEWLCSAVRPQNRKVCSKMLCFYFLLHEVTRKKQGGRGNLFFENLVVLVQTSENELHYFFFPVKQKQSPKSTKMGDYRLHFLFFLLLLSGAAWSGREKGAGDVSSKVAGGWAVSFFRCTIRAPCCSFLSGQMIERNKICTSLIPYQSKYFSLPSKNAQIFPTPYI